MKIYLGLGSNLAHREENIDRAVALICQKVGCVTARSKNYTSRPVGFESSHLFINAVVAVETTLAPQEILQRTTAIEHVMGKSFRASRSEAYKDRIIDIDLLLAQELVHRSSTLTLPHPHLHERDFVLLPFNEIAPHERHPLILCSIEELTRQLTSQPGFTPSVCAVP